MMRVGPPIANVLVSPDPWLAVSTVTDRGSNLGFAVGGSGIEPIVAFAALDIGAQIIEAVDRPPGDIFMVLAIPPIGQGHVIVDTDEIDVRIRPERVEMKIEVTRPVLRMIPEIFRPIRRVANLHHGTEEQTTFRCKGFQLRHRSKTVCATNMGQSSHFRADAKCVYTACRRAKRRLMQDETSIAPFLRSAIVKRSLADREIGG